MENLVKFEKNVVTVGGSLGMTISPELLQFLDIKFGDRLVMVGDVGKHGRFIAIWKKEEVTSTVQ